MYKLRKETIERSFADSKNNHGYRYAMYKGIKKSIENSGIITTYTLNILKKLFKSFDFWRKKIKMNKTLEKNLGFVNNLAFQNEMP